MYRSVRSKRFLSVISRYYVDIDDRCHSCMVSWKSVSVVTSAEPTRVWAVYRALCWHEWDCDIASMRLLAEEGAETATATEAAQNVGTGGDALVDGAKVAITMARDGKTHVATLCDVRQGVSFSYVAPLPLGASMVATHTLEALSGGAEESGVGAGSGSGGGSDNGGGRGGGTRITHTFQFTGLMGGVFRFLTAGYVQRGLDTNTAALKALAEADTEVPAPRE